MPFRFCTFIPGKQHCATEKASAVFGFCDYFITDDHQDRNQTGEDSLSDSAFTVSSINGEERNQCDSERVRQRGCGGETRCEEKRPRRIPLKSAQTGFKRP